MGKIRFKLLLAAIAALAVMAGPLGTKSSPTEARPELVIQDENTFGFDSFAYSLDGGIMALGNYDEKTRKSAFIVWNTIDKKILLKKEGDFYIDSISIAKGMDKILIGATAGERDALIIIYDLSKGKTLRTIDAGESEGCDSANPAYFASNGRVIISGSADKYGWNALTGRELFEIKCPIDGHYTCPFDISPDGREFAVGFIDGYLRVYDARTGRLKREMRAHTAPVEFLDYSPDGKIVGTCGYYYQPLLIWSMREAKLVNSFAYTCGSIKFSPDGKTVALGNGTADRESTILLDYKLGWVSSEIRGEYFIQGFSKDGKFVITESYPSLKFWNIKSEQMAVEFWKTELEYTFHAMEGGEWILYSPSGLFDASDGAKKYIEWKVGDQIYPASKFWDEYHRPGLFAEIMRGEDIH